MLKCRLLLDYSYILAEKRRYCGVLCFCNIINVSPDYLLSDSLKINAHDDYNKLWQKFCLLTPKQAELLIAMMEVMINKME